MLVSMKAVLDLADAREIAVGAFNITSLEGTRTILGATEELGQPATLQFAPVHESIIPLRIIGPVMVMMIEESSVPVCVHLDYGGKLGILREAPEMGFTPVMYDGPALPFEESTVNIRAAVEMVGDQGTSMETEVRAIGRQELSSVGKDEEEEAVESYYTGLEQARASTGLTGMNALACSFGTVHGLYLTTLELGFDRIRRIQESIDIPTVMHGGSGVSDEDLKEYITNEVRKINYYTHLAKAGGMYVKGGCRAAGEYVFLHDVTRWTAQVTKEDVLRTIRMLSHLG